MLFIWHIEICVCQFDICINVKLKKKKKKKNQRNNGLLLLALLELFPVDLI